MENQIKNQEEKQETKKSGKDKSKYVDPILAWGLIAVSFALVLAAVTIFILPLV